MSAYVVDDRTISQVVTHLYHLLHGSEGGPLRRLFCEESPFDPDGPRFCAELGAAMFALNVESVRQRYPDLADVPAGDLPGTVGHGCFTYVPLAVAPCQAFKSLRCWLYQACEGDCNGSVLWRLLDGPVRRAVADRIIEQLPAYEAATWGAR